MFGNQVIDRKDYLDRNADGRKRITYNWVDYVHYENGKRVVEKTELESISIDMDGATAQLGDDDSQLGYFPPPKTGLNGFPEAGKGSFNKESKRWRWKLPDGKILEWDKQHGEVEKYTKNGKTHLGSFNPDTGELIKDGDDSRTTPKFNLPNIPPPNNSVIGIGIGGTILILLEQYGGFLLLLGL